MDQELPISLLQRMQRTNDVIRRRFAIAADAYAAAMLFFTTAPSCMYDVGSKCDLANQCVFTGITTAKFHPDPL